MTKNKLSLCLLVAVATLILTEPAFAQAASTSASSDWYEPIVSLFETVQTGVGKIGTIVIGVGVMFLGIWAGFTGRMDWIRAGMIIFGGVLVTSGPAIASRLFGGS
ncbi:TrbC/VirB2 family protein [Thalassospira sp. NFXS8]|uniref:TrbC/VirB2 family protein n=1 Tax=Thalassospira sp. NFXS8 TaxID=2819093 RepID=UPI0032DFCE4C